MGMVTPETKTALAVDVGPQLRRIGLGILLGEIGRGVDDLADLGVDVLQFLLADFRRQETVANLLDRVLVVADFFDLLAGAVLRRVRHRMAAVAIGLHLQNKWAVAGAAPGDRFIAGSLHRADVHAVGLLARDVEGSAALGEVGLRGRPRYRRAHGVAVVLDDIDDGQLPQLRHVEAFIDLALVGGAVAEIGQSNIVIAAIAVGEGEPRTERDLRADDAVAAVKLLLPAEHVHGAALALGIAAAAAGQFGHHAVGGHAAGEHVPVVAVSGYDLIAGLERHLHADDDRLLADIEVAEAADRAHAVKLAGLFLKAPDQQHVAQRLQLLLFGELRGSACSRFLT